MQFLECLLPLRTRVYKREIVYTLWPLYCCRCRVRDVLQQKGLSLHPIWRGSNFRRAHNNRDIQWDSVIVARRRAHTRNRELSRRSRAGSARDFLLGRARFENARRAVRVFFPSSLDYRYDVYIKRWLYSLLFIVYLKFLIYEKYVVAFFF